MPANLLGPQPLDAKVNLRLTAAELKRLKEDARIAGLSVSALIRRRYFGRPILAESDANTIRELRRIGGLLKHIHVDSKGAYSRLTADALVSLSNYIDKLANDSKKS
jgi:hypothetical protein